MSNTISSSFPVSTPEFPHVSNDHKDGGEGFGDALISAFKEVDKLQSDANQQVSDLVLGKEQDVHSTLIAVEKADISFQLMMQVRNKIVNAYQEIARMQF